MRGLKIFIVGFIIVSFYVNCKKLDNLQAIPVAPNYYVENKLFHVVVNSDSSFTVSILHKKPNKSVPYNYEQAYQSSGFDYAFAPSAGDSVNVIVKSKSSMYVDVSYTGTNLEPVNQATATGSYKYPATCCFTYAEYKYVVKN